MTFPSDPTLSTPSPDAPLAVIAGAGIAGLAATWWLTHTAGVCAWWSVPGICATAAT